MNKVTVGIPAYNVPEAVIDRLLHTIKSQCPADIILCSDGDGKDYEAVEQAGGRVIKSKVNGGPGVARQKILDECKTPYITFIDADDLFATPLFLEHAVKALDNDRTMIEASYVFLQIEEDGNFLPHEHDNIWVFGKVYRKEFLDKYNIRFPEFRANEDTCFNKTIGYLADNDKEHITWFKDVAYYWMYKADSITRTKLPDGKNAYSNDQCFTGWLKSTTTAVNHARKYRPFSGGILQDITTTMIQSYFYHMKCIADTPFFTRQQWHFIKKFYNEVYAEIGQHISEEALAEIYSVMNMQNSQSMIHVIPAMGIREFFDRLKNDKFNDDDIYDIWDAMYHEHPEIMEENVRCGVMPKNYWKNPSKLPVYKSKKK